MGSLHSDQRIVSFGTFEADLNAAELRRNGRKVRLQEQPFRLLALLLERPGEVVTREEIQQAIWGDTFVDFEDGLHTAVRKLRDALGDSASNPRFVETLPRRGYRFIAPVHGAAEPAPAAKEEPRPQPRTVWPWVAGGAAALLLIALGLGVWLAHHLEKPALYTFRQLTRDTGLTTYPALSPDGKFLVYSSDRGGSASLNIWLQQLRGGSPIQLTNSKSSDRFPNFTPDGNSVVFVRDHDGIYSVPTIGGTEKRLVGLDSRAVLPVIGVLGAGVRPHFSPDGTRMAYGLGGGRKQSGIYLVSARGGDSKRVDTGLPWSSYPVWSPDGKRLLFTGSTDPLGLGSRELYVVPAEGGDAVSTGLAESLGGNPKPHAWLSADNSVYISVQDNPPRESVWRVKLPPDSLKPRGEPVRLTAGTGEFWPSAVSDGRFAWASLHEVTHIWSLPLNANEAEARQITSGGASQSFPSLSLDGTRMTYVSDVSGNEDIWLRNLADGVDRQITVFTGIDLRGLISPDGKKVSILRRTEPGWGIFVRDLKSEAETTVIDNEWVSVFDWSPDSRRVLYSVSSPFRFRAFDIETREDVEVLAHPEHSVDNAQYSPDGRWISFLLLLSPGEACTRIAPLENGVAAGPEHWIRISDGPMDNRNWWSPDGSVLYFQSRRDGFECVWAQRLDPATKQPRGEPRGVLHFHDPARSGHSGKIGYGMTAQRFYYGITETTGNIWLAEPVEE